MQSYSTTTTTTSVVTKLNIALDKLKIAITNKQLGEIDRLFKAEPSLPSVFFGASVNLGTIQEPQFDCLAPKIIVENFELIINSGNYSLFCDMWELGLIGITPLSIYIRSLETNRLKDWLKKIFISLQRNDNRLAAAIELFVHAIPLQVTTSFLKEMQQQFENTAYERWKIEFIQNRLEVQDPGIILRDLLKKMPKPEAIRSDSFELSLNSNEMQDIQKKMFPSVIKVIKLNTAHPLLAEKRQYTCFINPIEYAKIYQQFGIITPTNVLDQLSNEFFFPKPIISFETIDRLKKAISNVNHHEYLRLINNRYLLLWMMGRNLFPPTNAELNASPKTILDFLELSIHAKNISVFCDIWQFALIHGKPLSEYITTSELIDQLTLAQWLKKIMIFFEKDNNRLYFIFECFIQSLPLEITFNLLKEMQENFDSSDYPPWKINYLKNQVELKSPDIIIKEMLKQIPSPEQLKLTANKFEIALNPNELQDFREKMELWGFKKIIHLSGQSVVSKTKQYAIIVDPKVFSAIYQKYMPMQATHSSFSQQLIVQHSVLQPALAHLPLQSNPLRNGHYENGSQFQQLQQQVLAQQAQLQQFQQQSSSSQASQQNYYHQPEPTEPSTSPKYRMLTRQQAKRANENGKNGNPAKKVKIEEEDITESYLHQNNNYSPTFYGNGTLDVLSSTTPPSIQAFNLEATPEDNNIDNWFTTKPTQ